MSASEPRRLVSQPGELGDLLRQADDEYARGFDAQRAWVELVERKPARTTWKWLVPVLACSALLALPALRAWRTSSTPAVQVTAERLGPSLSAPSNVDEPPAPPVARVVDPPRRDAVSSRPAQVTILQTAPAPTPSSVQSASQPEEDCLGHARAGDAARAARCFEQRALGSGLSAQIALYELARLQRDALGDPARALGTLEQYLARFPEGSLNGEASFSKVELLTKLGRASEALLASAELLRSRHGGERAAEVHLLRGNLLRSANQPAQAVSEYRAALAAPGRIGDEAAFQLAAALEATGEAGAARTAYEQYLSRPNPRRAAAARARLEALAP